MGRGFALVFTSLVLLLGCEMLGGIDDLTLVPCEAGLCPPDASAADDGSVEADPPDVVDAAPIVDAAVDSPGDATLAIDADADADAAPAVCKQTLANVGTGDFTVTFKIRTTEMLARSILCQRTACGFEPFFHVRMEASGELKVDAYDRSGSSGNLTEQTTSVVVNDGVTHDVLIKRTSSVLRITVDGTNTVQTASFTSFGTLPPLLVEEGCPCYFGSWNADITDVCIR